MGKKLKKIESVIISPRKALVLCCNESRARKHHILYFHKESNEEQQIRHKEVNNFNQHQLMKTSKRKQEDNMEVLRKVITRSHEHVLVILVFFQLLVGVASQSSNGMIRYSVEEEQPGGTFVGNIATDSNMAAIHPPDILPTLKYKFHSPQGNSVEDLFSLDKDTGDLSTARVIDRDGICYHEKTCRITLNIQVNPTRYFQIVTVQVDIIDINDHAPVFPEDEIIRAVTESASQGDSIAVPAADDPDSPAYGIDQYSLLAGEDSQYFRLKEWVPGAEDIHLELKQSLDRESQESYTVTVMAYDGGARTGSITVQIQVLDVNDNYPRFSNESYSVVVEENVAHYTTIVRVHATDPDDGLNGQVQYGFSSKTEAAYGDLFIIDGDSGDVIVIGELDYESGSSYSLTITAKDRNPSSVPARAKLTVEVTDLNDNAPNIRLNTNPAEDGHLKVSEYSSNGTFLAHFTVNDPDSGPAGNFSCSLNDPHFMLQRMYRTEYKMTTATRFDHETGSTYDISLRCEDKGSPPQVAIRRLVIDILDENDHTPRFSHNIYTASLQENNEVGDVIVTVQATDRDSGENSRVNYFIFDEDNPDAEDFFYLDPVTGNLSAKVIFDREDQNRYEFEVIARDHGKPELQATATVIIQIADVNDEIPEFTKDEYEFHIFENSEINSRVGQVVARDLDTPQYNAFEYAIDQESQYNDFFRIDDRTGVIRTAVDIFDQETQYKYIFQVVASNPINRTERSMVTVVVIIDDINDNAPVIDFPNELNNTVQFNTKDAKQYPYQITQVHGHDFDHEANSEITYILRHTEGSENFFVNATSGVVYLNSSLPLTGNRKVYDLIIIISDSGSPPRSSQQTLYVDVASSDAVVGAAKVNLGIVIGISLLTLLIIIVLLVFIIRTRHRIQEEKKYKWMAAMIDPKLRPFQQQTENNSSKTNSRDMIWPRDVGYTSSEDKKYLRKLDIQNHNLALENPNGRQRGSMASIGSSTVSQSVARISSGHQRDSMTSTSSSRSGSTVTGSGSGSNSQGELSSSPEGLDVLVGTPFTGLPSKSNNKPPLPPKSRHKVIVQPEHKIQKPAVFNPNPDPMMDRGSESGFSGTDSGRGSTITDSQFATPLSTHWEQLSIQDDDVASCDMLYNPDHMDVLGTEVLQPGIHRSCMRNSDHNGRPQTSNGLYLEAAANQTLPPNHVRFSLPEDHGSLRSLDTSTMSSMDTMSTLSSYGGAMI